MATQELLQKYGTQLVFADHATDFSSGAPATSSNSLILGTKTNVQMNLSTIAAGAAWQSAKTASLVRSGSSWPIEWMLGACLESTATPAGTGRFDFFWAASPSDTAGNSNPGGVSGTDSSYTAALYKQLLPIGSLPVAAAVINKMTRIGIFVMPHPYGSLVIVNNTSVAMQADGVADESHIVLTPIIPDLQAPA